MFSTGVQLGLALGALLSPAAAQEYSELPDGVVHFPLRRFQQSEVLGIFKRDGDSLDISLNNSVTFFTSEIEIGSNKQSVTVQVDTGSSDLWVMDSTNPYCVGATDSTISSSDQVNCTSSAMFDSSDSSTYHSNSTTFKITYGDTTFASGYYGYDNIIIGGKTVSNANFAVANQSNSTTAVWGIGLLGSEALVTTIERDGSYSPTYSNIPLQMKQQGIISQNAYSLWLNDVDAEEGSLLFGGVDHAKYSGTLQTVPLLSTISGGDPNTFTVALGNLSLYQGSNSAVIASMSIGALLDSGSSFISLPTSIVNAIIKALGGTYTSGYAVVPCASTGGLTFNIAGIEIDVPFSQITFQLTSTGEQCVLGILPNDDYTILGDTFLRAVYAVYDLDSLEVALAPTVFNTTESNVEAITSGIPSASQAPSYSATNTSSTIYTSVPTFYKTGTSGSTYGDYPSGYTQSVAANTAGITSVVGNSTVGTATSSSSLASGTSSSSSKSKNAAARPAAAAGLLGAALGVLALI